MFIGEKVAFTGGPKGKRTGTGTVIADNDPIYGVAMDNAIRKGHRCADILSVTDCNGWWFTLDELIPLNQTTDTSDAAAYYHALMRGA